MKTIRQLLAKRAGGPVAVCHPDRRVSDLREMMLAQALQFIPVVEHGELLGIVTYVEIMTDCDQPAPAEIPKYDAELVAPAVIAEDTGGVFGKNFPMGEMGK